MTWQNASVTQLSVYLQVLQTPREWQWAAVKNMYFCYFNTYCFLVAGIHRSKVTLQTNFPKVASTICGYSVWDVPSFSLLATISLTRFLDLSKMCAT